jgi:hypothetical protein
MALVEIGVAIRHCRADPGSEDDLITLYLAAAEQAASDYLNRQIYSSKGDLDAAVAAGAAGLDPVVSNPAIVAAVLLTLGHLFNNREDVVIGTSAVALPGGARALLAPHRRMPGL